MRRAPSVSAFGTGLLAGCWLLLLLALLGALLGACCCPPGLLLRSPRAHARRSAAAPPLCCHPAAAKVQWAIHREAPAFVDQGVEQEILTTGIKVGWALATRGVPRIQQRKAAAAGSSSCCCCRTARR